MCQSRKCPGMTLGFFSVITILFGVAMVILSIRFSTSNFSSEVGVLGNYQNSAFYMLLIGSIVAVLTGVCGVVVCVKRVPIICNMLVGLFFLIAFLLLFVNGIAIAAVSNTKEETLQQFCNAGDQESKGFIVSRIREVVDEVDVTLGDVINDNMCSAYCPCQHLNNTEWSLKTSAELESKYGRTNAFVFDAAIRGATSYPTFLECFKALSETEPAEDASS